MSPRCWESGWTAPCTSAPVQTNAKPRTSRATRVAFSTTGCNRLDGLDLVVRSGCKGERPGRAQQRRRHIRVEAGPPTVLQQPVPEIAQYAAVEARIVEAQGRAQLEVDPAPHRLGCVTAGRSSRNCSTLTVASCAGETPTPCSRGYHPAKSSSSRRPPSRSRTHIAVVPAGLLARATPRCSSTSAPRRDAVRHHALLRDLTGLMSPPLPIR